MFPNVRAEMGRKNITLEILSKEVGCTIGTLSLKLNGKYPITLNEAKTIKKVLGVALPLEELFEEAS